MGVGRPEQLAIELGTLVGVLLGGLLGLLLAAKTQLDTPRTRPSSNQHQPKPLLRSLLDSRPMQRR